MTALDWCVAFTRQQIRLLIAAVVLLLQINCPAHAQDWKSRFENEARDGWHKLSRERFDYGLKSSTISTEWSKQLTGSLEIKVAPGCRLVRGTNSATKIEKVLAFNTRYRFQLSRKSGTNDWHIDEIEVEPLPDSIYEPDKYIRSKGIADSIDDLPRPPNWLTPLLSDIVGTALSIDICGENITEFSPGGGTNLFDAKEFSVESASEVDWDGHKVIMVGVTWKIFDSPLSATLWCDPNQNWAVVKWQRPNRYSVPGYEPSFSTFEEYVVTYESNPEAGFPQIKKTLLVKGDSNVVIEQTFDEFEKKESRAKDFTLSAFGLPEPPGVGNSNAYLFLVISLFAVALIAFGLFLRRRRLGVVK